MKFEIGDKVLYRGFIGTVVETGSQLIMVELPFDTIVTPATTLKKAD